MNQALDAYREHPEVACVLGYAYDSILRKFSWSVIISMMFSLHKRFMLLAGEHGRINGRV